MIGVFMTEKTVCFTGHRPKNLGFSEDDLKYQAIKEKIKELVSSLIENENAIHFISGMALGIDLCDAQIVIDLKIDYPQITLEAAVPNKNQTLKWRKEDKKAYNQILLNCDKISVLQDSYTLNCYMKRNKYMVDKSDFVIAVWNGSKCGKGNTVKYAHKCNKRLYVIDPDMLSLIDAHGE